VLYQVISCQHQTTFSYSKLQIHQIEASRSVVAKALRYKSEGPGIDSGIAGVFSVESYSSMCPGVDSASKNEYQVNLGGKGGRCVRLTTYHLHVLMSRNLGGLNPLEPCGPVIGQLHFYLYKYTKHKRTSADSYEDEQNRSSWLRQIKAIRHI
jgi:hypothetical protein